MLNEIAIYFIFILSSLALIIIPGQDMMYVIANSIGVNGNKRGKIASLGVSLGILTHVVILASGIAFYLKNNTHMIAIIQLAGGLYLLWIAYNVYNTEITINVEQDNLSCKKQSYKSIFINGFLSNVLNPKVFLFFISFIPQFINDDYNVSWGVQATILGMIFTILTLIVLIIVSNRTYTLGNVIKKGKIHIILKTVALFIGALAIYIIGKSLFELSK